MAKEFSPEERLLNLIKRKKKSRLQDTAAVSAPPPAEGAAENENKESIAAPRFRLDNILRLENIKLLNRAFFIVLIVVILYFLIDIFIIPSKRAPLLEPGSEEAVSIEEPEIKPDSYYSKLSASKSIFKPIAKEEVKESMPEVSVEELMSGLALLGIVSGENPQAIIEDKKQNKTFFLREGQSTGGVLLKRIEDGSVTIIYKGEEFSLSL